MNKNELAAHMTKDSTVSKGTALKVISSFVEIVGATLKKTEGKVTLVGFGTFKSITKKAKEGRNPKTGQKIKIPKKRVPKFVAGKELKDRVK